MDKKMRTKFDINLAEGKKGENLVSKILGKTVEIKTDFQWQKYGNFFIECECYSQNTGRYEKSGIMNTEAELWAIVLGDDKRDVEKFYSVIFIRTEWLRKMVQLKYTRGNMVEHNGGKNPTKGVKILNEEFFEWLRNPPTKNIYRRT